MCFGCFDLNEWLTVLEASNSGEQGTAEMKSTLLLKKASMVALAYPRSNFFQNRSRRSIEEEFSAAALFLAGKFRPG